jgi:hypothetical protein
MSKELETREKLLVQSIKIRALRREAEAQNCLMPDKIEGLVNLDLITEKDGDLFGVSDIIAKLKAEMPEFFTAKRRPTGGTPTPGSSPPSAEPPARQERPETMQARRNIHQKMVGSNRRM